MVDDPIDQIEIGNPINEKDFNRLELQHHLFRIIWNSNFSVPMQSQLSIGNTRVLEVGSCPTIWTFDMASEYPLSTFVGIENTSAIINTSSISSNYSSKIPEPRNAIVLQTNTGLPFPNETFDLVYHKSTAIIPLLQCLHNPLNTINQMIRVLKPGGWLEFMIIEKRWYNLGPITQYMENSYIELCPSFKINNLECTQLEKYLHTKNDLSCITIQTKEIPIGSFGGRIGEFVSH
ncbi:11993_t:CDS:2 [Funneliformis geosporum]|uniref:15373_t:CDS:1 n=1 Tax=Funneliformis geosporum TaxID=1117311 RepID=A0A9W4WS84_9GLOM|nr:11993_t:CDS:2 [Funneliformis geosporum]CAI2182342.1 15373_t:CDS:2 [Funneliformis geosporum]